MSDPNVGLRQRNKAAAKATVLEEEAAPAKPAKKGGVPAGVETISYVCVVGDTVASVALRHGMKVADLKKWNRLLSPSLFAGQEVHVRPPPPKPAANARAERLRIIMRRANVSEPEAAYYLDDAGGGEDVEAALRAAAADDAADAGARPTEQLAKDVAEWVVVSGALGGSHDMSGVGGLHERL